MNSLQVVWISSCLVVSCSVAVRGEAQDELVEMVTDLLGDPDKEMRALALNQIRTAEKGAATTKQFAELLPDLPAETQVGLLNALADRGDSAAAPAVRQLLAAKLDESVHVAAIEALGVLGSVDDLQVLMDSLSSGTDPIQQATRRSLIGLPTEVSADMVAELKESPVATQVALLQILTARRAREAIPAILETANDANAEVRQAAISALAELADVQHVPSLLPLVRQAAPGRERDAVERAIAGICQGQATAQAQASPLLDAMHKLPEPEQALLFPTLGRIGGPAALKVVDEAVESPSAALHAAGIRALCNWPDGTVTSRLLGVARTDESDDQRRLALRALIRIAPLADHRDDHRRLDTLRTVFAMCATDADRQLVIERAKAIRSIDTLRFLTPFLKQPPLSQQACLTIVELAHHSSLREANQAEFHAALDDVMDISKDATVIDRAGRYKKGQTWVRPK